MENTGGRTLVSLGGDYGRGQKGHPPLASGGKEVLRLCGGWGGGGGGLKPILSRQPCRENPKHLFSAASRCHSEAEF